MGRSRILSVLMCALGVFLIFAVAAFGLMLAKNVNAANDARPLLVSTPIATIVPIAPKREPDIRPLEQIAPRVALPVSPTRVAVVRVESKQWVTWGETRVRADVVDVRLSLFPRPLNDNGRGIHWFPTLSQKREVIDRFVPELVAMRMQWVVVLQGLDEWNLTANDYLIDRLNDAGIVPVMRIDAQVGALNLERLRLVVQHYRARGVRYYQIYNEPNFRAEWADKSDVNASQFIAQWLPAAQVVAENGGLPGLAPLAPTGDLDDVLFLENTLTTLVRARRFDIINVMWLAIHNYGGLDDKGFYRYRRYDAMARYVLGQHLPMLATEGGMGDAHTSADTIVAAFEHMRSREPWLLAYCPWLIGNAVGGGHDETWETQAWFQRNGALPIVERVKGMLP